MTTPRISNDQPAPAHNYRHHRTYRLSIEHVDIWAVLPLVRMLHDLLEARSDKQLVRAGGISADVDMEFEAFEDARYPQFRELIRALDDEFDFGISVRVRESAFDRETGLPVEVPINPLTQRRVDDGGSAD
jgi:hypothetical protein